MKVWMFNNYNMLPEHGPMNRHYYFGKRLRELGHEPVVFVGSHPHNTDRQLIEGPKKYQVFQEEPFPWVLVKTVAYGKSRKKQIVSMFQYYKNGKAAAKHAANRYGRPDVILGSSAHPLAALLAVRLGRKFGCRSVVEIRDLWPESIVALGVAGAHNPAVLALRRLEKWLYTQADAIVFTQEGAYDYILERGWEKEVPRSKVYYVNNGVDLDLFYYNQEHFQWEEPDLEDPETFKIVYTGSVRKANGLVQLVECAEALRGEKKLKFLAYGTGGDLDELRKRCQQEGLTNLSFKGPVEKKYIPGILARCDATLLNYAPESVKLFRFGNSQNKLFEYLASGKPVLTNVKLSYNPADRRRCCYAAVSPDGEGYAAAVLTLYRLSPEEYEEACRAAIKTAEEYDFKNLTEKLLKALEGEEPR